MLTFYNSERSPNCFKIKILLHEMGIDFEQEDLEFSALREPDYMGTFPTALVPAIEDDGVAISESGAIALYLSEKYGGPIPKTIEGRALMYQALNIESSLQAPVIGGMGIFGELGKPEAERDMARVGQLMPQAQRIAHVLGQLLGDRPYFAGEFSIADIQLYAGATKAIAHQIFQDPPQNLVAWNQRMQARPSVVKASAEYLAYRS